MVGSTGRSLGFLREDDGALAFGREDSADGRPRFLGGFGGVSVASVERFLCLAESAHHGCNCQRIWSH